MTSLIASGGIIAAIVGFWGQIKSFISKIISLVIKTDSFSIGGSFYSNGFVRAILKNSKPVDIGNDEFSLKSFIFLKNYNKVFPALFKCPKNGFYIYGKSLIYVNFQNNSISYLRGTFDMENFLKLVSKELETTEQEIEEGDEDFDSLFNVIYFQGKDLKEVQGGKFGGSSGSDRSNKTPKVLDYGGTNSGSSGNFWRNFDFDHETLKLVKGINFESKDIGEEQKGKVDRILLNSDGEKLFNCVKYWKHNESWFQERNIAHRGGALLYGPPGSGKSQTVKEICRKLGLRLYIFDLSSMSNQEFHEFFEEVHAPCVILIEDIDAIFEGTKNIANEEYGLTYDCLINHLSGALNPEGKFIMVTSNYPEKLAPSLMRAGRLDHKIEIGPLSREQKEFIANKILKDLPDERDAILKDDSEFLGADFEKKCIDIAVSNFWKKIA